LSLKKIRSFLSLSLVCTVSFLSNNVHAQATPDELKREFIEDMVSEHNFARADVESLLNKAQLSDTVLEAIQRPWEAKPWHQYYPIFLTDKRVQKGVEFWNTHAEDLLRAEKELGVPAEMIVAIIGVETFYGTYKGKYPVLDALFSLGFHYPPRAKFFRSELQQYMLLSREENFDPLELKGSYAGAMGMGQFISSSYRHYAIDFDGDGVRDLLNNPVDAIGSVANYFKKHGWQRGQQVAIPASVEGESYKSVLSDDLAYKHTWSDVKQANVSMQDSHTISLDEEVKLLEFELAEGHEYWVGLPNFYVITRYNHSPLYAMAVYQLSQQIKAAR
jgi:membrane-bound lytic murein transglycosylase B